MIKNSKGFVIKDRANAQVSFFRCTLSAFANSSLKSVSRISFVAYVNFDNCFSCTIQNLSSSVISREYVLLFVGAMMFVKESFKYSEVRNL